MKPLLVTFSVVLLGLALLTFLLVWVRDARVIAVYREKAEKMAAEVGASISGDIMREFAARISSEGVDVTLSNNVAAKLPGPSGQDRRVCLVTFPVSVGEALVCKTEDRQLVIGALAPSPAVDVGESAFAQRYRVFLAGDGAIAEARFRDAATPAALGWASPTILRQLLDFDLQWASLQDGKAELAFAPIDYRNLEALLSVAANFSSACGGRSGTFRPVQRWTGEALPRSPTKPLAVGVAVSLLGSFPAAAILLFLPWTRDMNSETVCGEPDSLIIFSTGDGYNVRCANNWGRSVDPHFWICVLLFAAMAMMVAAAVAATRSRSFVAKQ